MKVFSFLFSIFLVSTVAFAGERIVLETDPLLDIEYNIDDTKAKGLQVSIFLNEKERVGTIRGISQLVCKDESNYKDCFGVQIGSEMFTDNELKLLSDTGSEKIYEINHFNAIVPIVRIVVTQEERRILHPSEFISYGIMIKKYKLQIIERNSGTVIKELNIKPEVAA